ncbi:MAG: HlyD family efflux transporter periplasmic adaptor subunit [Propionicimonas sp.]|uniref:HlyD family efflux transporter periplasmic adaptor subunit n=1 Tax=Propionicimonas sp. TaxID=1955623 RepID=UPI003D11D1F2
MNGRRLAGALAALALLAGCTATPVTGFTVTGTVDDDTDAVTVPILSAAVVDLNVGFADSDDTTTATDPAAILGLGSSLRLASVTVREGDTVAAGQVVASLDDGTLTAQVSVAKADQKAAKAQVDVLEAAINTTYDKAGDVKDAQKKVDDAISKAKKTRTQLAKALTQLKKARKELTAKLAAAEQLLANYPPTPPPGTPTPDELRAAIAQLKAAIRTVDANIAKIREAQPQLDAGIKKANQASRKLDEAAEAIVDARATLKDAKVLAEISADAAGIPVELARVQVGLAELTAPVSGVVVSAARTGDVLAPGASVVEIRPDGPSTVTAWLSPAQAAQVCLGDAATMRGDWMTAGAGVEASLTRLGTAYTYPPTDVTTDEIHLTRALEVQFSATTEQLPAGVPVDITLTGCRPATDETNG